MVVEDGRRRHHHAGRGVGRRPRRLHRRQRHRTHHPLGRPRVGLDHLGADRCGLPRDPHHRLHPQAGSELVVRPGHRRLHGRRRERLPERAGLMEHADLSADVARNLTLGLPVVLAAAVWRLRSTGPGIDPRRMSAAFLGFLLAWTGVLAVQQVAGAWWTFGSAPTTFLGMPLETSIGWALVWGALPALIGGRWPIWLLGFAWVDRLTMPALPDLVTLHERWWVGELVLLGVVALPALLLSEHTRRRTHLHLRTTLQLAAFGGLVIWLLPTLAFSRGDGSWATLLGHGLVVRSLLLMAAVAVAVPAIAAVAELTRVGRGTPFPWDPPERLVTTGPYAYLANPMQLGGSLLLALVGVGAGSWTTVAGAGIAVVFSVAVAERHEREVLAVRWPEWAAYRSQVRAWLPRWRPYVAEPATLWVSATCDLCSTAGDSLKRLGPRGLVFRPAEDAGVALIRMRWTGSGYVDRGVAAYARALEHANLATAWVGWLVRLPILSTFVQVVADASGAGPRTARWTDRERTQVSAR
ncbi:MAG: isoprenylcysteine carboxylmethyltransferase family protein [Propionibacteriales bacterium]|nr:isoprenylcysteine carboxylmethyltransferase family protein [Propionibacteriales bacterium]